MTSRCEDGYSLFELMVALFVMALIATAVTPFVGQRPFSPSTRAFAGDLMQLMAQARYQAVFSGTDSLVTFELDKHVVTGSNGEALAIPRGIRLSLRSAAGETIGQRTSFRFFGDGSSSGGLVEVSGDGPTVHLAVNWLTGSTKEVQP